MNRSLSYVLALLVGLSVACGETREPAAPVEQRTGREADAYWGDDPHLTAEELERGRLDAGWRQVVVLDTIASADTTTSP